MELHLNMLLEEAGLPLKEVRLLRHQHVGPTRLTPYVLWRDDVPEFERYQSAQRADRRSYFSSPFWASFVVPPDGSTLFVGLYEIGGHAPAPLDWSDPLQRQSVAEMGRDLDIYAYRRVPDWEHLIGRLKIDWGSGKRSWAQKAASAAGPKRIVELTPTFREPIFPGYSSFISSLGALAMLPTAWATALSSVRGVYLLTCPRTKEQYVGSATGEDGFWGRWQSYAVTGHGGNVGLRSRDPSDYQISILEVAGSAATVDEIVAMEQLWKVKLQSREMGLNRN
jgi:hypothetical protein